MPRVSVSVAGLDNSLQLWSPLCAPSPSVTLLLCSLCSAWTCWCEIGSSLEPTARTRGRSILEKSHRTWRSLLSSPWCWKPCGRAAPGATYCPTLALSSPGAGQGRQMGVSRYWKTQRYDFSSPMKMAEAFAVMRQELNRRAVEATRREYDQLVQELDRDHQSMSSCLSVKPLEMQRRLEGKRQELLERCWGELRGEDPQKQAALEELKKELDKQMAEFLPRYEQRFKMAAMMEEENRKAVEASRRKYEQFVQQLDRGHQSMRRCLSVKPAEIQ
ncbi:uncharacterized protein LOC128838810 [Malaclemys terrapin pileata]|uniref:uncharacterized protein LOC128838810 n=1 Tax=Malaclemys terrapin pileata TaxID=2991368 RepID=UPI0023A865EB|nr:uncharacterized protein LOC128838810 [Malaclemys terrapin pileata]